MNHKSLASVVLGLSALSLNFATAQPALPANGNVTTNMFDLYQSGVNSNETVLTPDNVKAGSFGQLFTCPVDGQAYAQPLYLSNVTIPGKGAKNLVFVATCHDSVYAFDADAGGDAIWHTSFLSSGVTPCEQPQNDLKSGDIMPEIGIVSTPTIDIKTGTIYVVAKTKETGRPDNKTHYVQKIHALDVTTGAEKFNGPKVIGDVAFDGGKYDFNLDANPQTPFVEGTAKDGIGGKVYFNAMRNNQRSSLTLYNGVVYVGWSSHGDTQPYHGWLVGFDATTLLPVPNQIFCTTPDGQEGGIWQAGSGPVVDNDGNLYISCGNGTFDAPTKARDFAMCFMKFNTKAGLTVTDFFAPHNEQGMSNGDGDIGSAGCMLLDVPGTPAHLMTGGDKNGQVWVLNRDSMGKFDPATDNIVQMLQGGGPKGGAWVMSGTIFFNNTIFSGRSGEPIKAFSYADGKFSANPIAQAPGTPGRGGGPIISAHGTTNGIVWIITGSLIAYKADDMTGGKGAVQSIFNGRMPDGATKFTHPIVINGKVYACSFNGGGKNGAPSGHLTAWGLTSGGH